MAKVSNSAKLSSAFHGLDERALQTKINTKMQNIMQASASGVVPPLIVANNTNFAVAGLGRRGHVLVAA